MLEHHSNGYIWLNKIIQVPNNECLKTTNLRDILMKEIYILSPEFEQLKNNL
jgi:hypothetical protein